MNFTFPLVKQYRTSKVMESCFGKDFSFQISWKIKEGFIYYVNRGIKKKKKCRFMPDFGLFI